MSKKNYIFVRVFKLSDHNRTEINEMQSNVFLAFENNAIEAFVDKSILTNADGILIDGFDAEDLIPSQPGRRKRDVADVNACKLKCRSAGKRQWTGPVLDEWALKNAANEEEESGDWEAFVRNHATATGRCVDKCLSKK